jgi:hypothetical protein
MGRIKRKSIKFTEDSLNDYAQECYNDSHNYRAMIMAILSKWSPLIKDEGQVAAMGKDIVNLMNALARTNDQKLVLLKILKDIVFAKKEMGEAEAKQTDGDQITLSQEAQNELLRMADEARKRIESSSSGLN